MTAVPQLELSELVRRPVPDSLARQKDEEKASPPESFDFDRDRSAIVRHVKLRGGGCSESVFVLDRAPRKKRFGPGELDDLADLSFLTARAWPELRETGTGIRTADMFSGCGVMSLGVWEAARA